MDTTREAYRAKMAAQLGRWSARLDGFKASAETATAAARIEILKHASELEALEQTARQHIAHLEDSAAETWDKVRSGIEQAWDALGGTVDALWAQISPDASTNR